MMNRFPLAHTALMFTCLLTGQLLLEGTNCPVFAEVPTGVPADPVPLQIPLLVPPDKAELSSSSDFMPARVQTKLMPSGDNKGFLYVREGRPDPFFPFLSQEIAKAEAKARSEATGTQKYDPGQLTLVAIVFAGRQPLAMVQDSAGVGYTVRKGDKIGQGGTVLDVLPGKVLVSQKVDSPGSQEKSRTIELILNTEGGK